MQRAPRPLPPYQLRKGDGTAGGRGSDWQVTISFWGDTNVLKLSIHPISKAWPHLKKFFFQITYQLLTLKRVQLEGICWWSRGSLPRVWVHPYQARLVVKSSTWEVSSFWRATRTKARHKSLEQEDGRALSPASVDKGRKSILMIHTF